jgi:hypothetical protein
MRPCSVHTQPQRAYPPKTGELSLQEALQADLTRLRGYNMRFAEGLDAAAEKEERPERLCQLNNASVKAARAGRQIAVLQLESAGERPLPNVRAPAAAANANKPEAPKPDKNGPRPCPRPWDKGDYTDYDDYTDDELRIVLRKMVDEAREKLRDALDEDFRAAGRERLCRESFDTKLELIGGIPHPTFDECLKSINSELALLRPGPAWLDTMLKPRSPDALAEYDAQKEWVDSLQRRDSS